MNKLIISLAAAILSLPVAADEGMWLLPLLKGQKFPEMQALGLKLQDYDIYSPDSASLKDAVVIFGGGCTGEIVSPEGLLLTNHHCGYGCIQRHSTLEHDYLTDGFWAMSRDQELPNPGMTVTFIDKIEDVTDYVKKELKKDTDPNSMNFLSPKFLNGLAKAKVGEKFLQDNPGTEVEIKAFYGGNQYFMFTKKIYSDIRLVGAPPSSIGKFGADTERAVRAYQRFAGLTVDGVVGRTTWNSLYGRASQLRSSGPVVTLKRLPYPGTPLTVGSSGETVLYYNLLLLRIAYYFSSVEAPPLADRYTEETATATRSAQQLLGLEQTGIADADTWTAVEALSLQLAAHAPNPDRGTPPGTAYPGRAIAEGSAGQEVGQVERWLNRRAQLSCGEGYVADNNRFGASDAAAVRAVQQQAGLQPVNGIVYRETWHALQAQCTDPCGCEKEE